MQYWNTLLKPRAVCLQNSLCVNVTPLSSKKDVLLATNGMKVEMSAAIERCKGGQSRLFKIDPMTSEHEDKHAIVELSLNNDDTWQVSLVRGVANQKIDESLNTVASDLAYRYNIAWRYANRNQ